MCGWTGCGGPTGFELGDTRIEAEWLHSYHDGSRHVWLDRVSSRTGDVFRFSSRITHRFLLEQVTRDNALVLSVAGAIGNLELGPLHLWFATNLPLSEPIGEDEQRRTYDALRDDEQLRERLADAADLGICGIDVDELTGGLLLAQRTAHGAMSLSWARQSSGTRTALVVLHRALDALDGGRVLLVDDLGAGLHPRLTAEIIRLFTSTEVNTRGAQLVFTSHAASLLGARLDSVLEPCHIWLADKDSDGATDLFPLTSIDTGDEEDLGRSYLVGSFGGVPQVLEGQVARRLLAVKLTTA